MRGVNFISEWVVVSSPTGPACLFDSSPQSVNMPVYDRIGFKKKLFMVNNTSGFGDYENACLYQNIDASFGILYQPHSLSDVTMSL